MLLTVSDLPLYHDAPLRLRENLDRIAAGERAPLIEIGTFTEFQYRALNDLRQIIGLHPLVQNEIIFIGRHLYNSRIVDGYRIEDMIDQIASAMSPLSIVSVSMTWTRMDNPVSRPDRYGNQVNDRVVFEMTAKRPRAELFSVMPKGDTHKPAAKKKPI